MGLFRKKIVLHFLVGAFVIGGVALGMAESASACCRGGGYYGGGYCYDYGYRR